MLGLRQSLVTTGKVTPPIPVIKVDIGTIGSAQDGGAFLLSNVESNNNQSVAYSVIPTLVGYVPSSYSSTGKPTYVATWENARTFAEAFVACSQSGENDAVCKDDFKVYPQEVIGVGDAVLFTQIITAYGVVPQDQEIITTNPNTFLLRKWYNTYYTGQDYAREYIGSRYIWGPKVDANSNFAYVIDLNTGDETQMRITEKCSFLLFRTFTYNTFLPAEDVLFEQVTSVTPAAIQAGYTVETSYNLRTPPSNTQSGFTTNSYTNDILMYSSGANPGTVDLEIVFDAIQTTVGGNSLNLFIQPPFDKVKKVNYTGGSAVDLYAPPGMKVIIDVVYSFNNTGTRAWHILFNKELTLIPYYQAAGQSTIYPKTQVTSVAQGTPKITYIYKYRLDLNGNPGFRTADPPDVIGPLSFSNFRFKFDGYKETNGINYGRYGMKNIPNTASNNSGGTGSSVLPISFPPDVSPTKNLYTINKSVSTIVSNPQATAKYFNIFNGLSI